MTKFLDDFSEEIWKTTYKDHSDESIDDTLRRVAKAIASVESTSELRQEWEEKFNDLLSDFKGTCGGRTYSNAGTQFKGTTLLNCFVSPRGNNDIDSLDKIIEDLRNQSFTLKSEGGWGQNFSWIRPRGSFIAGVGVETPGAVKYMELYDKASEIITAGSGKKSTNNKAKGKIRKGAMMGVLDCFGKNTEILTSLGWLNVVDVVEMLYEDKDVHIICEDGKTHKARNPLIRPKSQLYMVELEDGSKIETTGDHKFVVQNQITKEVYLKALKEVDPAVEFVQSIETLG